MCVNLSLSRLMLLKQVFPRENTIIKISTKSKTSKTIYEKYIKKKKQDGSEKIQRLLKTIQIVSVIIQN